jgi:hypothetical protein
MEQLDTESLVKRPNLLVFVKRVGEKYPGNVNAYPGTTLQEVFRCCIDRLKFLDAQVTCEENELVILHLKMAIYYLEKRAYRMHGIEQDFDMRNVDEQPVNSRGHIWKESDAPRLQEPSL